MPRMRGPVGVVDRFTPEVRSRVMSRVRGKHTGPELKIRRLLHAEGYRYRLHPRTVPGRPDLAFMAQRVALFIDGCFWHGCPHHYTRPSSNVAFWDRKLESNLLRRTGVLRELRQRDWRAVQVWECQLHRRPASVMRRIRRALATR